MREKYNGVLIIDKEAGYTSHDVVARLRGILKQRRIGHTGTLDPDAVGVLPVCLGNATRLCDMLTEKGKTYRAVLLLGVRTDTQDISGNVVSQMRTGLSDADICGGGKDVFPIVRGAMLRIIDGFKGEYLQKPPMYSAVKVDGRRLYELAREGREVERRLRRVRIENITVCGIRQQEGHVEVEMVIDCSKGTYIRTLCHDIGERIGCGGCMKHLQRVRSGSFTLEQAYRLGEIERLVGENEIEARIIPTDACLEGYGSGRLKPEADKLLMCGNMLGAECFEELSGTETASRIRVYDSNGDFMATYVYSRRFKLYKPEKMFL